MNKSQQIGIKAEELALEHLRQNNLQLIQKNFVSRFGEIDLIMQDKDTLVFVEVKKRCNGINSAIESITYAKQKKLVKSAQYYLLKGGFDRACRFDAIALDKDNNIQWLKNVIIL
ncbi:MAG: YraN family protein [Burkholderiales bacterium]|nr:YraN family protein [Burkholderiales bacterium]